LLSFPGLSLIYISTSASRKDKSRRKPRVQPAFQLTASPHIPIDESLTAEAEKLTYKYRGKQRNKWLGRSLIFIHIYSCTPHFRLPQYY
jgi:hypothetical protein